MNNNNNDIFNQNDSTESVQSLESVLQTEAETPAADPLPVNNPEQGAAEYAFRWEYSEQTRAENEKNKKKKKKTKKGAVTYAVIMIAAFLIAFSILAASLAIDDIFISTNNPGTTLSTVEVVERGLPSSVMIICPVADNFVSCGSGFVVNDYGYVVTSYHVVDSAVSITVFDYNDRQYPAEIVSYDEDMDVALLYAESLNAPAVTFANSDNVKMGEQVVAIGCPAGSGYALSASAGIISGLNRSVDATNVGMFQTDVALNPGNSGGPLFDTNGNVVGLVTSKKNYHSGYVGEDYEEEVKTPIDGISYVTPVNAFKDNITKWIAADLQKPMLGISTVAVEEGKSYFYEGENGYLKIYSEENGVKYKTSASGEKAEITESELNNSKNMVIHAKVTGLCVVSVTKGLGADGKLVAGDIISEINGVEAKTTGDVRAVFATLSVGDSISAKVYRNGSYSVINMTLKTKGDMLAAEKATK